MEAIGRRERKKAQTHRLIAATAARLFAGRGYEKVTVADVARAADVSVQTVYNYFPTKEHLVLDQEEEFRDRFVTQIRNRAPGTSPAAAIREEALTLAESVQAIPPDQIRGELGYLAAISPTIHRLSLEMTDRLADAIAAAIASTTPGTDPGLAKVEGIALAWVSQTIIDEVGQRLRDGQDPGRITAGLRPMVKAIIDDLDRWLSGRSGLATAPPPHRTNPVSAEERSPGHPQPPGSGDVSTSWP
ncbi:MAG: TetR/AcrR family transcriptional regulator [Acidimicrobiales bacterium]